MCEWVVGWWLGGWLDGCGGGVDWCGNKRAQRKRVFFFFFFFFFLSASRIACNVSQGN